MKTQTKTFEQGLKEKFAPYEAKINNVLKIFKGMDFESVNDCLYEVRRRAEKKAILS